MERRLDLLSDQAFDVCVVGGGIYGACIARDAAMRGLKTSLIEKYDFGHGTSFNSQKTIHGGFRYLQNLDVRRVVAAAAERRAWMTIAPHLVHRQRFLIPLSTRLTRSRWALGPAAGLYAWLTRDSSAASDPDKAIPPGQLLTVEEWRKLLPEVEIPGMTGGALFYDGLIHSTERLNLAVVRSAHDAGACVANYVEATGFIRNGKRVAGVKALDCASGRDFELKADMVVLATGPWSRRLLAQLDAPVVSVPFLKVMWLMLRRPLIPAAVGLPSPRGTYCFALPWHDRTLVGVRQEPADPTCDAQFEPSVSTVDDFIAELNESCPSLRFSRDDVVSVRGGYLPAASASREAATARLATRPSLVDYSRTLGVAGVISVIGVKYTMARRVAETIVDVVVERLDRAHAPSQAAVRPVAGGQIDNFANYLATAVRASAGSVNAQTIRNLVLNHGSEYDRVVETIRRHPETGLELEGMPGVTLAEIEHIARNEMVETLADVVFRRTMIGAKGAPVAGAVENCAEVVGRAKGWTHNRRSRELRTVLGMFDKAEWSGFHSTVSADPLG